MPTKVRRRESTGQEQAAQRRVAMARTYRSGLEHLCTVLHFRSLAIEQCAGAQACTKAFPHRRVHEEKVCLILAAAMIIFAISIMVCRTFMYHNFFLMASKLLIEYAWLLCVIFVSLLIRIKGDQIKSGFRIYTPIMLMSFVVISFRIIFIPNNLVQLISRPYCWRSPCGNGALSDDTTTIFRAATYSTPGCRSPSWWHRPLPHGTATRCSRYRY